MFHVFGACPFRADGDLLTLGFAPDGSLWSVEEPGVLRHWQPTTGERLDWQPLSDLETLWAFNPEVTLVASGSDELTLWDPAEGKILSVVEQPSWVTTLAFSPDMLLLASGHDDGVVRLWDLREYRLVRELHGHDRPISALAFNRDGLRLASAGEDKHVHLWTVPEGTLAGSLLGHTDRIPALVWHPQGHRIYSAGWDTTVRVWDTSSCEPIILLNSHAVQVNTMAVDPAGRLLACADSTHAIHIWDLASHKTLRVLREHTGEVRCLAFSPDGRQLASGGGDRMIRLWTGLDQPDPAPEQLAPAEARPPVVTSNVFPSSSGEKTDPSSEVRTNLALSPDGKRLACIDGPFGMRVWDTRAIRLLREDRETGPLYVLAASPDGRWIAGGGDQIIYLWDAVGERRQPLPDGQPLPTTALTFTLDGSVLASASSSGVDVWLWNTSTAEPLLLIPEAVDACAIEAVAFHPDGRLLAVGGIDWLATSGSDGGIMVWDVVRRCPVAFCRGGVRGLAFHPSGQLLASASLTRTVRVWDALGEKLLAELTGHEDMVHCVAYSSDGSWLASGGADRTVRLWDADTGRLLAHRELDTQVKALAFSPDGHYLFTGNGNTSCYQLDVQRLLEGGV